MQYVKYTIVIRNSISNNQSQVHDIVVVVGYGVHINCIKSTNELFQLMQMISVPRQHFRTFQYGF